MSVDFAHRFRRRAEIMQGKRRENSPNRLRREGDSDGGSIVSQTASSSTLDLLEMEEDSRCRDVRKEEEGEGDAEGRRGGPGGSEGDTKDRYRPSLTVITR